MVRSMAGSSSRLRRGRATAAITGALAVVLAFAPPTVSAATVTATWAARLGTAGANGSATIRAYWGGTGSLTLALAKLPARSTRSVTLSKGTCSSIGSALIRFPAVTTTSSGTAARASSLTVSQVSLIRSATAGTGRIALRVGATCGAFPPNPFPSPTLVTVGPAEVVFNWSTDRCEDLDIPDLPARAFRDSAGNVQLLAAHYINRRFVGPTLDTVKHDCAVVMASAENPDPGAFGYREWIASPYTTDGQTIYALVHDEYYGSSAYVPCTSAFPGDLGCWYNAITLAVSTDGGASYHPAATPPGNLVASAPEPFVAGAGPYGFFNPSNIIKGPDGYYYAYMREHFYRRGGNVAAICVMRTRTLSDASSWRAWDGTSFPVAFVNPYVNPVASPSAPRCASIPAEPGLGVMDESVTFNTYLKRYVMVGLTAQGVVGGTIWGVYYSFSDDLVHWSTRQLLFAPPVPETYQPGDAHYFLYPSLLDPNSPSPNFETTGQHAYLYLTRFNPQSGNSLNRDLIRIPVEFFPSTTAANAARVPFVP
jgi:hypothetical protein